MRAGDIRWLDKGLRTLQVPVFAVVLAAAWTGPATQAESGAIEARYELLSMAEQENGTTVVTLQITFTNDTNTDFADMTVRLFGDGSTLEDGVTVAVGPLWVGESVSRTTALRFLRPLRADGGLKLFGEAAEADGVGESIPVKITEGKVDRGQLQKSSRP